MPTALHHDMKYAHRVSTPPPIATLSGHSSTSLDVHNRPRSYSASATRTYPYPPPNAHHHHHHYYPPPHPHDPYSYAYPPPTRHDYAPQTHPPYALPAPAQAIVYTEDAATKLSDRVRRRCFNCCTTDTSTWRRSNLSPGKVLCNKCGLFERTHSRPRPDQFPHKRGPLASSTLGRSERSPPLTSMPPSMPPPSLPSPPTSVASGSPATHPSQLPLVHTLHPSNVTNSPPRIHNQLPPIHASSMTAQAYSPSSYTQPKHEKTPTLPAIKSWADSRPHSNSVSSISGSPRLPGRGTIGDAISPKLEGVRPDDERR
ncbi:gata transcription factor [Moniliophthora roreri MCA 2997]|uniref:Gata transcription factor n=2 Tax=Moniliophthora roreri TaxID=221103 RepID=V2X717_MONRO|nr:gata transcription factor [Moniliophthora roreri MCA 2997]KAI3602194.1 gata transcription factor [Moniliophthora roreri]